MNDAKVLPTDPEERKRRPLTTGCLDYFPAALAEVAYVSWVGNQKHNPGEPLHWSRDKSTDHVDCEARHLVERGGFDEVTLPSGETVRVRHSAERAWRALADLQLELEADGAPPARGATNAVPAVAPVVSLSVVLPDAPQFYDKTQPPAGWVIVDEYKTPRLPGEAWWCSSCLAWHCNQAEPNVADGIG